MDYQSHSEWTKKLTKAMIFACIVSGVLTFCGMQEYDEAHGFFGGWIQPALLTALSVVGAIIAWQFIFQKYPRATPPQKAKLLIIGIAVILFLLTTSTFFAAFGMASDKGLLRQMESVAADNQESLDVLYRQRAAEGEIVGPLMDMSRAYLSLENREIDKGFFSNKPGPGAVSGTFGGMKDGFANAADSLKKLSVEAERDYEKGSRFLGEMREIAADEERPMPERSREFQRKLSELNGVLTRLEASALPRVRAIMERLDQIYLVSGGNKKIEATITAMQESVGQSKEAILEKIADLENAERKIPRRTYRVLDRLEAVIAYWPHVFPAFSYALAADLGFPVMALMFLSFLGVENAQPRVPPPRKDPYDGQTGLEHDSVDLLRVAERLRRLNREKLGEQPDAGQERNRRGNLSPC